MSHLKSFQYCKNAYVCEQCHTPVITIDRDHGTTPFIIRCKNHGCGGEARSRFYRIDQALMPTHEWYHPDAAELATLDLATQEHVRQFGLILREIVIPNQCIEPGPGPISPGGSGRFA